MVAASSARPPPLGMVASTAAPHGGIGPTAGKPQESVPPGLSHDDDVAASVASDDIPATPAASDTRYARHPLTLRFQDPALEQAFVQDHANRAIVQQRTVLILLLVISAVVDWLLRLASHFAPLPASQLLGSLYFPPFLVACGLGLYLALIGATFWRPARPYLQQLIWVVLLIGTYFDGYGLVRMSLAFSIAPMMANVIVPYTALRLRFVYGTSLALLTTAIYFSALVSKVAVSGGDPRDVFLLCAYGVTVGVMHLVLATTAYNTERTIRDRFLQTRLIEEHRRHLATALRDLKNAEAQLVDKEKHAVVGRLVAGILHELNTPLGTLHSSQNTLRLALERFNSHLEGGADETRTKRAVDAATSVLDLQRSSSDRISEVIRGLRRFVSLDEATVADFDLQEGIRFAAVVTEGHLAPGTQLDLQLATEPLIVRCYPASLNQVFLNLILNASTAVEGKGGGTVTIQTRRADAFAEVVIADDGPGIDPLRLAGIFEPGLERSGQRVKLRLGLPTAKKTIEAAGGAIELISAPGEGTTVRVRVPLR